MSSDADTPICVESSDTPTPSTAQYGYDDGYRMRNLWIDMLVGAYNRGLPVPVAVDAADTAVARYKAKFDVK